MAMMSCEPAGAVRGATDSSSIVAKIALTWGAFIVLAIVATQVLHAREATRQDTAAVYFEFD